jgi:uncharacterized membrane protein YkoI/hemoglobin-like flavoprotein
MKKLIITLLLLGIGSLNAQQRRPFLPKPPPEKPEIVKGLFGQWLDKDGYITDGPKIKNWVDSDRDRIDDRFQAGPGKPAGKKHPEVGKPKPDLQPEDGELIYEVEIDAPNGVEYELEISAKGKIIKEEREEKRKSAKPKPPAPKKPRAPKKEDSEKEISLDKAPEEVRQAVMNFIKTNGGKIEEVSVEKEDGELIYEVEIDAPNGVEYELEISAKGKIIKEEREEKRKSKKPKAEKPERPARPEVSDEIKDKLDSYKKEKKALGDELKKAIKDLEKPSRKAVKELMEVFHTTHKVRFDAQKELGNAIKEGLAQNRPERPKKPEVSAEVKKLHKSHADKIKELHESKKKLMTSLKDVKGDERKKLLDGFREEQKSLHNELKSIQKQLREQIVICTLPKDNKPTKERVERRPPPRPESKEKNTESRRPTGR